MTMRLGRYRLLGEMARGGMGIVWLARSEGPFGFEKLVVVKELKSELTEEPRFRDMFLDEARLAARLSHPNIVQTNEVGEDDGRLYMALELLEGCSLHDVRRKLPADALPLGLRVRIVAAVLDALHHAHELTDESGAKLNVVHRDLSPRNVLLTYRGEVKLLDFGVAKTRAARRASETKVGVLKGSVPYMSPDHAEGRTIDRRADVFAAGVLLRELVTGMRLWEDRDDDVAILRALVAGEIPAFPADDAVPAALRAVCERAMAPVRSDRYATAAHMREALDDVLMEVDPRGSLVPPPPNRPSTRRPWPCCSRSTLRRRP